MPMTTREVHFRVRDLDSDAYEKLRCVAKAQTGKASVSLLAKQLLFDALDLKHQEIKPFSGQSNRIEIRLDQSDLEPLQDRAQAEQMTVNGYIRFLVQNAVAQEPLLTTREVEALYQSNAQLLRIGRNINQIAKSLNTSNPTALSVQELKKLQEQIADHTEKVGRLVSASFERMR